MEAGKTFTQDDRDKAKRGWRQATTFLELCELTAKFIEGSSPYFPASVADTVDSETLEIGVYLAAFNRVGFLTTGSQPGYDTAEWKQRAFVEGFALEGLAKQIAGISLHSELHIVAVPPTHIAGFHTPVIVSEFRPHGWSGFSCFDDLEFFKDACGQTAFSQLEDAWSVSIIDLKWGRNDSLWPTVAQALCYSTMPHPDLGLDFDFAI